MNVSNVSSRDMAMWKAFAHDMADNHWVPLSQEF